MSIQDQIQADMKGAMKARQTDRLGALRLIRAELLKAEKDGGGELDDAKEMAVLQRMLKQRRDSIEQYEKAGRADLAAAERAEAEIVQSYLPEGLSDAEIDAAIDEVLASLGAPDPKMMGKVMGQVMGKLKSTGKPFDGKAVNARVRAKLET